MPGDTELQTFYFPSFESRNLSENQRKHRLDKPSPPNNVKKVRSSWGFIDTLVIRNAIEELESGANNPVSVNSAKSASKKEANYTSDKVITCDCGCERSPALNQLHSKLNSPTSSRKTLQAITAALNMPLIHTVALIANMLFASFPNIHPEKAALTECLKSLIYRVSLADLKVQPAASSVEYYPIWESEIFTMCVFVLKKGVTLPIHDHPQMTVFSKIVSGDLLVKTFELTDEIPDGLTIPLNSRLSKVGINGVISSSSYESLLMIHPEFGPNVHSFTAVSESVVILDIIGPPYNDDRPCTYYHPYLSDTSGSSTPNSTSILSSSLPDLSTPPVPSLIGPSLTLSHNNSKKKKKKKKQSKNQSNQNTNRSVDISFGNLQLNPLSTSPPDVVDFNSQSSPIFDGPDLTQNVILNNNSASWKIYRDGVILTPPSVFKDYCILVEDPDIDYECTERRYIGQQVRGSELKAMEKMSAKYLLQLANSVLAMFSSRATPYQPVVGPSGNSGSVINSAH